MLSQQALIFLEVPPSKSSVVLAVYSKALSEAAWHRCVVPELLLPAGQCRLLPEKLREFPSGLGDFPGDAEQVAREVLKSVYLAAKATPAGQICVPLPPASALQVGSARTTDLLSHIRERWWAVQASTL